VCRVLKPRAVTMLALTRKPQPAGAMSNEVHAPRRGTSRKSSARARRWPGSSRGVLRRPRRTRSSNLMPRHSRDRSRPELLLRAWRAQPRTGAVAARGSVCRCRHRGQTRWRPAAGRLAKGSGAVALSRAPPVNDRCRPPSTSGRAGGAPIASVRGGSEKRAPRRCRAFHVQVGRTSPWRHRHRRSKRRCNGWPVILCRRTRQTHFASWLDCAILHRTATAPGGRSDLKPQQYICSRVERKKDIVLRAGHQGVIL
jgi:hypothetical protein